MTVQSKKTPVWKSIHDAVLADITEGRYGPGDKLPTEATMARRFGVNRHTVRRALAQLAEDNTVHARRGSGVFVAQEPTLYPISKRVRFHQNLRAAGLLPAKEVLVLETRTSSKGEADALKLDPKEPVHVYEGLSLADDAPIGIFRSVFPASRFPDLHASIEKRRSITAALKDHGIEDYTRAWTHLTAKRATATQALHLRITEGAPLLRSVSLNLDVEGIPIEYGRTWFAGDRVTLTVSE
jgi:GntR family phosphonate transport system transcriptional regulator